MYKYHYNLFFFTLAKKVVSLKFRKFLCIVLFCYLALSIHLCVKTLQFTKISHNLYCCSKQMYSKTTSEAKIMSDKYSRAWVSSLWVSMVFTSNEWSYSKKKKYYSICEEGNLLKHFSFIF